MHLFWVHISWHSASGLRQLQSVGTIWVSELDLAVVDHRDTVQLYEQLYESGLQYGPAFRLLRNVHVPDTE